jgi:hypothetical protein
LPKLVFPEGVNDSLLKFIKELPSGISVNAFFKVVLKPKEGKVADAEDFVKRLFEKESLLAFMVADDYQLDNRASWFNIDNFFPYHQWDTENKKVFKRVVDAFDLDVNAF